MGYALFKVTEEQFKKISCWQDLPTSESKVKKLLQLTAFKEFADAQEVLRASVKLIHGKLSSGLKSFLKENSLTRELQSTLLVGDKKIAQEINKKLGLNCVSDDNVIELTRCVRSHLGALLGELDQEELKNMALGLSHGLGRFKIRFSSEKVDTMVIQAVGLLEDLDKEINNYAMRLKEWYGYHFPELAKVVSDTQAYTKVVKELGLKENYESVDLIDLIGEELAKEVAQAAELSMGAEITEHELEFITGLADQLFELFEYRASLEEYLINRMLVVAPNLSAVVGELIAAKLIAKAGSLIGLAKQSASTIQIMGAEKALFKALRAKKKTPKYGIIYQTKILAAANGRVKGKMSRALAAKSALCVRLDALAEEEDNTLGLQSKEYLEKRMAFLDKQENQGQGQGGQKSYTKQYNDKPKQGYNSKGDVAMDFKPRTKLKKY